MGRKARQISELVIDEISLVDKGANQHAVVTIAKNATGENKESTMDIFDEQGNPLDVAALDEGDTVYDDDGNAYVMELENDEEDEEEEEETEPVGKSHNPFQRANVSKSLAYDIREELSKALTDKDRDEVIAKALSQFDGLSQQVEIAKAAAAQERELRMTREYTEIAKSYNLPIEDSELGGVLMRCAESLSDEDCHVISKCMEAAGSAIFEEYGFIGGGDNVDVMSQVNAEVSKSAGDADPSDMQAYFEANPEAYDQYLAGN